MAQCCIGAHGNQPPPGQEAQSPPEKRSIPIPTTPEPAEFVYNLKKPLFHLDVNLLRSQLHTYRSSSELGKTDMEPEVLEHILDGRKKPTNLQFSLLKKITENFSEEREIGKGGFATVYKGVLPNRNVAVKRIMNRHTIDDALFYREVDTLLAVNHQNIVQFLGFCASTDLAAMPQEGSKAHIYAEQRERLLCFEYIGNGSLQEHITDELRGLEWNVRYEIIKGICNGLDYLHNEKRIYHMDLKPANVLLDSNMVPKITDFGQSRYDEKSQTIGINRYGSRGYCPPEYVLFGKMSPKSDMYSLGMIIIELVTGGKEIPNNNKNNVLRRWRHRWRKMGMESPLSYQQVTKCIEIGLLCQEIEPCNRPFISDIVRDINETEVINTQISNDNESTVGHISPYSDDDMLGIEPLELHFPFELNKEMSCLLELTNETDSYIAFEVKKMSPLPYCIEPHKGIVAPRFKCSVDITLQPQDKAPQRESGFIVRSTRVNSGFTTECVTMAMFNKSTGNDVDEVNLDIVFDPEVIPDSSTLLDVYPLELSFHFEPNKLFACSLDLTNNTHEQVAFGLLMKRNEQTCFLSSLPLFGIVDPGTIYTLVLMMDKQKNLPRERNVDLILQSTTYYGNLRARDKCIQQFQIAEKLGNTVHKVILKGVCALQGGAIIEHSIPPSIKIISMENATDICSMEANNKEPLIITGSSNGLVRIWSYNTQGKLLQNSLGSVTVTHGLGLCVKFIARKGWFLAQSHDGFIHVYNYRWPIHKITSIRSHSNFSDVHSLAIHPTKSYVLSACPTGMNLLDWDYTGLGWKHTQKFKGQSRALAVNPEDYSSFASVSNYGTIKVWSLDSPKSKYTLPGHRDRVNCLEFFTRDGQQYLITGSDDRTAKIWDMQKKECIHRLSHRSEVRSVLSHPKLPVLVTGTEDGHVYLWSSISFRLKRILNNSSLRGVVGLACLMESGRVAVAQLDGMTVIEIRDEEEQGSSSGNDRNSISASD